HGAVHRFVGVGGVLGGAGALDGVVDVVQLHGAVGAPAPQQRGGESPVVCGVPAHALNGAGNAQLLHLAGEVRGQALADVIPVGVEQRQLRLDAVLLPDAVLPYEPAGLVQQGGGALGVVLHLGGGVVPGHLVADAVGGAV